MAGREQGRDAPRLRCPGELDAIVLTAQPDIAQDQIDRLSLDNLKCIVELIGRRDDLVPGVAEDVFVIERGQRLILDDKDPLDDLLVLPEQHADPKMTSQPQRTRRKPVPHRRRGERGPVSAAPPKDEDGPQRIAKLLARAGVASRREGEGMIAEGRIALNGDNLTTPATELKDLQGAQVDG